MAPRVRFRAWRRPNREACVDPNLLVPPVSLRGAGRRLGGAPDRRRAAGRGGLPGGERARRRPPRRGGGTQGRRAVRLAGARGRRHRDRSGADRDPDGQRREGHLHAGAGHGVRRGDDHDERDHGPLAAADGAPTPHGRVQPRGHRSRAGDRGHAGGAVPGVPDVHDLAAWSGVLRLAADVRRDRVARAVPDVRGHPDRAAPRLLPAGDGRRAARWRSSTRTRRPHGARCTSLGLLLVSLVAVVGLAKLESPADREGRRRPRPPPGLRGRGDRAAGAAAGDRSPPPAPPGWTAPRPR